MRYRLGLILTLPLLAGGCAVKEAIDTITAPPPSAAAMTLPAPVPVDDALADELDRVCPLTPDGAPPSCPRIERFVNDVFRQNDDLETLRRAQ